MNILHLSSEYPDELRPRTIVAIRRLVSCSDRFADNHVVSLHRRAVEPALRVRRRADHTILCERGSILPFRHRAFIDRCAQTIIAERLTDGVDLIHAHKLTTEGCIARQLKEAGAPDYCVSVRATDLLVIRRSPHRRGEFLRVLTAATRIAPIAPWMLPVLRAAFGKNWTPAHERKLVVLGNVVDGELLSEPTHNGRYALPLRVIRSQLARKNVLRTLKAVRRLRSRGHDIRLDIIGGGSGVTLVNRWIKSLGLDPHVALLGAVPNAQVIAKLSYYKALALFSYPETFGLVYLEALRAGIPLLHASGTGVDGLFPGFRIGVSARHESEQLLSDAFLAMEAEHELFRAEVQRLHQSRALDAFGSDAFTHRLASNLYVSDAGSWPDASVPPGPNVRVPVELERRCP